jgi:hypothetical protein
LTCCFTNVITFSLNATLYENLFCLADIICTYFSISPCYRNRKRIKLTIALATERVNRDQCNKLSSLPPRTPISPANNKTSDSRLQVPYFEGSY